MTENEKMLADELYDCGDPELMTLFHKGKNLAKVYNALDYAEKAGQVRILDELLGGRGRNTQITASFFADYGATVAKAIVICDELAAACTEKQREAMTRAYVLCTKMEWMFWGSAYKLEQWPL